MKFAPLYDEYVQKNNPDDWEDDCVRFVGFIDIMGFKDMVARYPHEDIKHILLQMNQSRTILLKMLGSKSGLFVNTKDQSDIRVRSFTFSDSVVFITKSDSAIDLLYLSVAMCICQEASIQSGVPTKGAISHGKLTADFEKSIFFGQPIIDAYLLQEQLFYYGVIVDNNAEVLLKKFIEEKNSHFEPNHFIRISTPLKNGKVNHFNLRLRNLEEDQLDYLYNSVSGQPRKYVDNTIEIYKEMTSSDKS